MEADLKGAIEFLPVRRKKSTCEPSVVPHRPTHLAVQERLYYVSVRGAPPASMCSRAHFFCIDNELVYWKCVRGQHAVSPRE